MVRAMKYRSLRFGARCWFREESPPRGPQSWPGQAPKSIAVATYLAHLLCVFVARASIPRDRQRARSSPVIVNLREQQMAEQVLRFVDGAAYEQNMGIWSRLAGEIFLDWLAPPARLRWIDIGCGNGAFTELLIARCAPAEVQGIDPSDGQLEYARGRPGVHTAKFLQGDAMAIPFDGARFDAAVMALVLVFVPEPRKGIAEM